MRTLATISRRRTPSPWWLVFLIPLFFLGQGHEFWAPDEPREAEIAREIYVSGDWIVPRLNGRPFLEKPPLTHWGAVLTFHALGGPSDKWCRLPSALWGLAGALAAAWLGTMLAGRTAGLLSAFILSTNVEWALNSRVLHVDMPLAASIALFLALFWYGYKSPTGGGRRLGYAGCAAAAGAAFMAKGTIGIILPGAVCIFFLIWRREWRELARVASPLNAAVFGAIVIPWILLLQARGGSEALRVFLWDNQVLRFFSPSADHAADPWFYLNKLPEALIPWALFLPPALLRLAWSRGAGGEERRAHQFLLVAAAVPFVILSAASAKRVRYLLPLMPVFSIAIAAWLSEAWTGSRSRWERLWRRVGLGCAGLVAAGAWFIALYLSLKAAAYIAFTAVGAATAAAMAVLAVRRAFRPHGGGVAPLTTGLLALALVAIVLPPLRTTMIDSRRSYGGAMKRLVKEIPPEDVFYGYEVSEAEGGAIAFHRGETFREIGSADELAAVLSGGRSTVYMTQEIYERLSSEGKLPAGARVAARFEHPRGAALLVRGGRARRADPKIPARKRPPILRNEQGVTPERTCEAPVFILSSYINQLTAFANLSVPGSAGVSTAAFIGDSVRKPVRDTFLVFGAPMIEEPEIQEVVDCLRSGWISTGPRVGKFEDMFRDYTGAKHARALASCTAGLHLSMLVSGIKPGDEVITTPMTFAATANVITHVGAVPVFADVDRRTMNIDPGEVRKKATEKTRALIPVHFAGRPCDMDPLLEIAREHNLFVIEDAAHAIEAVYRGRKIGTIGDLTCFSFYVTKNIITGEGGMVTTDNDEWAEKIEMYGLHGLSKGAWRRYSDEGFKHYEVVYPGYKYNMTDMQAALGIHQLPRIKRYHSRREEIWRRYDEAFRDLPVFTPAPPEPDTVHARHLYTLLIDIDRTGKSRDEIQRALHEENIGTGIHFIAVHLHKYYRETYGYKRGDFPNAEYISDRTISLPLSARLTDGDVEDVISAVRRVLG